MPQLHRPGAVINYEVWGLQGPWVTLINGHTRPLNDFRLLGRHLNTLGLRVLALDNRGAGQSEVDRPFRLRDMADDVAGLCAEVGITATTVLGISMGGFIATALALDHPALVRRLVLISTATGPTHIRSDDRPWSGDESANMAKLSPYFSEDFARRNPTLIRNMARQIAKSAADGSFQRHAQMQRDAIAGFDVTPRIGDLKVPTLIVHGEADRIILPDAARLLATRIVGAELRLLPGAGHLLLAESAAELYRIIGEFVRP